MITQSQINTIIQTLKPYHPKRIGIFGSVARNEETDASDIDILYQFDAPITLFDKCKMKEALEKLLNRPVDLVSEKFISPKIKSEIMNDLNIIYEG